jgi:hypothetical protein
MNTMTMGKHTRSRLTNIEWGWNIGKIRRDLVDKIMVI